MKEDILKHLFELRDDKYKDFHSKLCPDTDVENIIGIRVPVLRNYAKQLIKNNPNFDPFYIGNVYCEEIMLTGMIIGQKKFKDFESFKQSVLTYIPMISNWSLCDVFCSGLKQTEKFKDEMLELIKYYLKNDSEFQVRFGVVMLLGYYIDDNHINTTLSLLKSVNHNGYYVKMAVAWALSVALVKYYDLTLDFMQNNNFDKFTHNKALQKARESYRISNEQKAELQKLKIV